MLLEKITPEEIELIGILHDPKAMVEILFPAKVENFEMLKKFTDSLDDSLKIRLYQIPMLSYEYLLANDPKLDINENFKLKKKLGSCYIYCGRKIGKCEWKENYCTLANGEQKKFKDLINTIQEVICLDENNLTLTTSLAFFHDNGLKSCYKVNLASGKEIILTSNHPLLTQNGWKRVSQLKIKDFIATPRILNIKGKITPKPFVAELLGYLLGDGSCSQSQISFTNINKELINEIYKIAKHFNCDIRKYKNGYFFKYFSKSPSRLRCGFKEKNNIQKLVLKYKINKLSKNKTIPLEVFKWKKEYIAILINRLFACDASIYTSKFRIEITLASKEMIYQIQSLLLRFGIHSRIRYKFATCEGKSFDSWRLYIVKDFDRFLDTIGIKSKDTDVRRKATTSTGDRIPKEFLFNNYDRLSDRKREFSVHKMKLYDSSRKKLQRLALVTQNEQINGIANSDIYWDVIKSIDYVGMLSTVEVQVNKYHNYISNNIVSHNSLISLLIDLLLDTAHHFENWITAFGSFDETHVKKIFEPYSVVMKNHPFFKLFNAHVTRKSPMQVSLPTGHVVIGVNNNIKGREPGTAWESIHAQKIMQDEHQYETNKVAFKRSQSTSELGAIERFAGITSFKKMDPAGKIFNDPKKKSYIVNLPEYISPWWNEDRKREAIEDYSGEDSIDYRIHVLAEMIDDALGVYQMKKVRSCYRRGKLTKTCEVSDESFANYRELIIGETPRGVLRTWIAGDFGTTAPTEIVVVFEYERPNGENIFRYEYNITLTRLTIDEQTEIFEYIIQIFNPTFIALDSTQVGARQVLINLGKKFHSKHLIPVAFNEKIAIDFEKDEDGRVIYEKGKPKWLYESVPDWSIRRLKFLLYSKRLEIPEKDIKFDRQFNAMVSARKTGKTVYGSSIGIDHLHQAFQVLAIAQWSQELKFLKPIKKKKWGKGAIGTL